MLYTYFTVIFWIFSSGKTWFDIFTGNSVFNLLSSVILSKDNFLLHPLEL